MLITTRDVARMRRVLFRDDDADAEFDEQGFGHPDRRVDFTIRPVSAEWRLGDRAPRPYGRARPAVPVRGAAWPADAVMGRVLGQS